MDAATAGAQEAVVVRQLQRSLPWVRLVRCHRTHLQALGRDSQLIHNEIQVDLAHAHLRHQRVRHPLDCQRRRSYLGMNRKS